MNKILEIYIPTKPILLNSINVMKTFEEFTNYLMISTADIYIINTIIDIDKDTKPIPLDSIIAMKTFQEYTN